MSRGKRAILRGQRQSLGTHAGQLYAKIAAFAKTATREHFTLDGFYHATQLCTTAEGSEIEKEGSVLTVDEAVEDLFLERGFTAQELESPLLYLGVYWRSRGGKDRSAHGNHPLEIRRTYLFVGDREIKVVEREQEGAWVQAALREEDIAFLKKCMQPPLFPLPSVKYKRAGSCLSDNTGIFRCFSISFQANLFS